MLRFDEEYVSKINLRSRRMKSVQCSRLAGADCFLLALSEIHRSKLLAHSERSFQAGGPSSVCPRGRLPLPYPSPSKRASYIRRTMTKAKDWANR